VVAVKERAQAAAKSVRLFPATRQNRCERSPPPALAKSRKLAVCGANSPVHVAGKHHAIRASITTVQVAPAQKLQAYKQLKSAPA